MIAIAIAALIAGQTPAQEAALVQSFGDAVESVRAGTPATFARPTKFSFGRNMGAAPFCARCTGYFTPADFQFYAVPESAWTITDEKGNKTAPSWLGYTVVTVCADAERTDPPTYSWGSAALPGTCAMVPGATGIPSVTVTTFDDGDSQSTVLGWSSACGSGPDCRYQPPPGPGGGLPPVIACPPGLTMPPGSFTGTVLLKTSVEWAGSSSTPKACEP